MIAVDGSLRSVAGKYAACGRAVVQLDVVGATHRGMECMAQFRGILTFSAPLISEHVGVIHGGGTQKWPTCIDTDNFGVV